ncbi:MAG: flagellar biosynthesis anti-sigma factor FlgM [Archangiaceae bacterium]|nr:flagellar biosynthesis anti-sigma factor FlgM [Archangiaceae bacterium]
MKVTETKISSAVQAKAGAETPVKAAAPVEKVSVKQSEAVNATIAHVKSGLPADRTARIQEIATAVKKGQYQPNAQQIAERIMDQAELEARLRALLDK